MPSAVLFFVSYTVYVPHAPPSALAKFDTITPRAPAFSMRIPRLPVGLPAVTGYPVLRSRAVHPFTRFTIVVSMRAFDAGVAVAAHSSSGRHVGYAGEIKTNLPFAFGSHFANSLLSFTIGSTIV